MADKFGEIPSNEEIPLESEFLAHNHNDIYYSKTETDGLLVSQVGDLLLATTYDPAATSGCLFSSQYNPND